MNRTEVRKYGWYAIGEVVLIFLGISLALWFENWNDQRQLKELEQAALSDIAANLRVNVNRFENSMAFDESSIAACRRVIANLESRAGWNESLSGDAHLCRWWTSPYLQSAAYESLKSQGVQLISNRELRGQIVALYENFYNYLVNDTDRSFWGFQDNVIEPVFNRHMRRKSGKTFEPVDYEALVESQEFLNLLYMKLSNQMDSITDQEETRQATLKVIAAIEAELEDFRSF